MNIKENEKKLKKLINELTECITGLASLKTNYLWDALCTADYKLKDIQRIIKDIQRFEKKKVDKARFEAMTEEEMIEEIRKNTYMTGELENVITQRVADFAVYDNFWAFENLPSRLQTKELEACYKQGAKYYMKDKL